MAKEMFEKMMNELDRIKAILNSGKNTGKMAEIERDLMLSKLRIIYEFLLIYQPDYVGEKPTDAKTDSNSESKETPLSESEKKKPEQHLETPPLKAEKKLTSETHTQQPVTIADTFNSSKSFLNEVLSKYADTFDISRKLQSSPLNDIFAAIGINDRFLLIKELFNDDSSLYKSTLDKLNSAENFNSAIEYLDSNYKWDFENPTVQKLLELIRRRHPIS